MCIRNLPRRPWDVHVFTFCVISPATPLNKVPRKKNAPFHAFRRFSHHVQAETQERWCASRRHPILTLGRKNEVPRKQQKAQQEKTHTFSAVSKRPASLSWSAARASICVFNPWFLALSCWISTRSSWDWRRSKHHPSMHPSSQPSVCVYKPCTHASKCRAQEGECDQPTLSLRSGRIWDT